MTDDAIDQLILKHGLMDKPWPTQRQLHAFACEFSQPQGEQSTVEGLRQGNWSHPDGGRIVGWLIEQGDKDRMKADAFCLPREIKDCLDKLVAAHREQSPAPESPQAAAQSTAPKLSTATTNDAGIKALHDRGHRKIIWSDAEACYLAMIAAAPSAQSTALEPVAWTLTETLNRRETTTRGYLWFTNPQNCMWSPLYATPSVAMALLGEVRQALSGYHDGHYDPLIARIDTITGTGRKGEA